MKEWKFEVMSEKHIAEINKLWDEGYDESLLAFALESANAAVKGYERGRKIAKLMVVGGVVVTVGAVYIGKKVYRELKERKAIRECIAVKEEDTVLDEGES